MNLVTLPSPIEGPGRASVAADGRYGFTEPVAMGSSVKLQLNKTQMSHVVAWFGFLLLVLAILKFLPLVYSLTHGWDLGHLPLEDPLRLQRAWALDLISDTGYPLLVWRSSAINYRLVGRYRWLPWGK